MSYEHKARGAGDLILSADWNAMGDELQRVAGLLEQDEKKATVTLPVPLRVFGKGSPKSPLSVAGGAAIGAGYADRSAAPENGAIVEGSLGVGTPAPKAKLHVVHQEQDANGGAVVLGPDSGASLRLGYHKDYAWIQSHGARPLKINPLGNDLSLGPQVVVQADGDVGIGTQAPSAKLHVEGDALLNGGLTVRDSVQFVNKTRQMLNLWKQEYGIGIQGSTQYFRTAGHFAWYRGGAHDDAVLSPGGGTPQMVIRDDGNVGIGIGAPAARLDVRGGDIVAGAAEGQRFIFHTRSGAKGDFLQVTSDDAKGGWQWAQGITLRRDSGNVGIAATDPKDRLEVKGPARLLTDANPLRFTSAWSGFPDSTTNQAEISNDTGDYKTLMIVGNRSAGLGRRVSVWDRLEVNGFLEVRGKTRTGNARAAVTENNKVDKAPGDWSQLPGMTLKVDVEENVTLLMFKTGGVQITGAQNGRGRFRMLVDGNQVAFTLQEFHNAGWELRDVSLYWLGTLSKGKHDIAVQWHAEGGTLSCCWYNDNRNLIAIEL